MKVDGGKTLTSRG
jgi:hypothetical protein